MISRRSPNSFFRRNGPTVRPTAIQPLRSGCLAELHDSRRPFRRILVGLVELVEVDLHARSVSRDGKAILVARRAAAVLDVVAVRLEARVMLRARELLLLLVPAQRGVLVRAREVERVY